MNKNLKNIEQDSEEFTKPVSKWKKITLLVVTMFVLIGIMGSGFQYLKNKPQNYVKVGSIKIPNKIIALQYQNELQKNIQQALYNPQYPQMLLNNIINQSVVGAIITNEALRIGIKADEDTVIKMISEIQYFQNEDGSFNKELFSKQASILYGSDAGYLEELRHEISKENLLSSIISATHVPSLISKYNIAAIKQKRTIQYITLKQEDYIKNVKKPTSKELHTLLKENSKDFMLQEYRGFKALVVNLQAVTDSIKISNKKMKEYYNKNKENYKLGQQREVWQLVLSDEKKAKSTYEKVKKIKDLKTLKKKFKFISIGTVTKEQIPDFISKPVFSQAINSISKPIKSDFGWHIVFVEKEIKSSYKPYKAVKDEIKAILQTDASAEKIEEIKNYMSNKISESKSYSTIAKNNKYIKYVHYKNIDSEGLNTKGKEVKSITDYNFLITKLFTLKLNESSAIEMDNSGYLYTVTLNHIKPSKVMSFAKSKPRLIKRWNDAHALTLMTLAEQDIINKWNSHKKISNKIQTITMTQENSYENKIFNPISIKDLFTKDKNTVFTGSLADGNKFVAKVVKISKPNVKGIDEDTINQFSSSMRNYFIENIVSTIYSNLENSYKPSIDMNAIVEEVKLAQQQQKQNDDQSDQE